MSEMNPKTFKRKDRNGNWVDAFPSIPWNDIENKPHSIDGYGIEDAVSDIAFGMHTNDVNNPHGVTYRQVGAEPTITGAATTITKNNLTANKALVSDKDGKVGSSSVTSTELGYLSGVTSSIQTQLNGKSPTSHTHNYAGSSSAGGAANSATKLATARTLTTNLGSTTGASFNGTANASIGVTGTLPIANGGTGATTAEGALTNLGLTATVTELNYVDGVTSAIQTQLNGKQATITGAATTIASSNLTASRALISNSSGKVAVSSVTSTELGYLSGVTSGIQEQLNGKSPTSHTHNYAGSSSSGGVATSATKLATARTLTTNLGSTTGASFNGTANASIGVTGTLPIANGGTGATTASAALSNLGVTATATELNYVDGVTSNVQTQLNAKAVKSKTVSATLSTTWSGKTQTVSVSGITASSNGFVGVAQNATEAQREAARMAWLSLTSQAAGSITITADGQIPTIAIPITITILG